jgi:pimeloyl-ACP methyl ester carboxylesterase
VSYQTIATELDKRSYAPRGQLYTVNGHPMHMVCKGEGSPAVILQAGGVSESLWWYRIQNQLAEHTQVCAYDRPGLGWSEPVEGPRDALTIVNELHTLLEVADIPAPYVLAGHSYGAILTRIYAAQYPEQVEGIVLVDSALLIPRLFADQSEFDQWRTSNDVSQVFVWGMTRTSLMRLILPSQFQQWGYPAELVPELAALRSSNQVFDADYTERIPAMWALQQASAAAENLGDLPTAVLWADDLSGFMATDEAMQNFLTYRDAIAGYSDNSVSRMVEGADHGSILGNEQYAQQVSDAVLDVIAAATGEPLAQ